MDLCEFAKTLDVKDMARSTRDYGWETAKRICKTPQGEIRVTPFSIGKVGYVKLPPCRPEEKVVGGIHTHTGGEENLFSISDRFIGLDNKHKIDCLVDPETASIKCDILDPDSLTYDQWVELGFIILKGYREENILEEKTKGGEVVSDKELDTLNTLIDEFEQKAHEYGYLKECPKE